MCVCVCVDLFFPPIIISITLILARLDGGNSGGLYTRFCHSISRLSVVTLFFWISILSIFWRSLCCFTLSSLFPLSLSLSLSLPPFRVKHLEEYLRSACFPFLSKVLTKIYTRTFAFLWAAHWHPILNLSGKAWLPPIIIIKVDLWSQLTFVCCRLSEFCHSLCNTTPHFFKATHTFEEEKPHLRPATCLRIFCFFFIASFCFLLLKSPCRVGWRQPARARFKKQTRLNLNHLIKTIRVLIE